MLPASDWIAFRVTALVFAEPNFSAESPKIPTWPHGNANIKTNGFWNYQSVFQFSEFFCDPGRLLFRNSLPGKAGFADLSICKGLQSLSFV